MRGWDLFENDDMIGYIAIILLITSFACLYILGDLLLFLFINIIASLGFIFYGLLINNKPIIISNTIILIINSLNLYKQMFL